jgi:hypothetical protein
MVVPFDLAATRFGKKTRLKDKDGMKERWMVGKGQSQILLRSGSHRRLCLHLRPGKLPQARTGMVLKLTPSMSGRWIYMRYGLWHDMIISSPEPGAGNDILQQDAGPIRLSLPDPAEISTELLEPNPFSTLTEGSDSPLSLGHTLATCA